MTTARPRAKIRHVLCPSDLTGRSQKALGFAARLAETLGSELTACHCVPANWFTAENRLPKEQLASVKTIFTSLIRKCQKRDSNLRWRSLIIENSFDPARDILSLSREIDADLVVMKARPGVLSAFRFGSIVERIVEGAKCPVLLLPSRFLADRDPVTEALEFKRILFDYDFSNDTDQLFHVANTLSNDYHAELEVLSVLEPVTWGTPEMAPSKNSRASVDTFVRTRLNDVIRAEGVRTPEVTTAVEWGGHAEKVLEHAKRHDVDLICTSLAPPHFYYEKLYSVYLGSLLKSARCPILVKQSGKRANPPVQ